MKNWMLSLVLLAGFVPPANSQTSFAGCIARPGDPICQVMGGVYRQREEIRARRAINSAYSRVSNAANLYGIQDHVGAAIAPVIIGAGSGYYGGYGRGYYGRGQRVGAVIGGAAVGAGIGYGISGTGRGAVVGGIVGGGVVGLTDYVLNRRVRGPKPVDCGKKKLNKKEAAVCEAAVAEAQAETELAERQRLGKRLYNSTRFAVDVVDCGQVVGHLRPRSSAPALEARCGYVGVILAPDPANPGRTVRHEAAFRLTEDGASGWVFRTPVPAEGGAR